ncbi:serine/threonine protein kinase [Pseudohyphozyma bogoriensis]|nr:serine/threonine protein kinase [Pseudohyphozyma bogoriensis]
MMNTPTTRVQRPVLAADPFVSNAKLPAQFGIPNTVLFSPYTRYESQNAPARSPTRTPTSKKLATFCEAPPSPATSPLLAPVSSDSTKSSSSLGLGLPFRPVPPPPTLDVEMVDAFSTPPSSRTLPTVSRIAPVPAPIKTTHLLTVDAPLTPPLTPPYTNGGQPLPSPVEPYFPTQSARLLYNYPLHPAFDASYTLAEELGCGGFGFVVRANRNVDGLSVAVKFIERAKIPAHGWAVARDWRGSTRGLRAPTEPRGGRRIPMEAYVLAGLRLEGVVAFIELFEDDRYFYLVMEHHGSPWQSSTKSAPPPPPAPIKRPMVQASLSFTALPPRDPAPETPQSSPLMASATLPSPQLSPPRPTAMMRRSSCDLFECIEQHSRFSEDMARYVFAQIVEVVYQLGLMGVCHRDIKDENIVISSDLKVKLIDFGSAVIFDPRGPPPVYDRFYGTTAFASPEILKRQPYTAPSSEVWSLGVLLSILVTGECPFANPDAAMIGRLSPPRVRISWEVEELMKACLRVDVDERITVKQIRESRWLRGALRPPRG